MTYPRINKKVSFTYGDRVELRKKLVNLFLRESAGTGKGVGTTRYTYEADVAFGGHRIELWRPAMLNKGMDFTVRVPTLTIKTKRKPWDHIPKHEEAVNLLKKFKRAHKSEYILMKRAIFAVYKCRNPRNMKKLSGMDAPRLDKNSDPIPGDVIVFVIKWLFAEQDVAYWNQSGREMLADWLSTEKLM